MDNLIIFFLTLIAFIWGMIPFWMKLRFRKHSEALQNKLNNMQILNWPKVSVIMPCKGTDLGFEENLQKLLNQDYPNWDLHFSVATESDLAIPFLSKIVAINPERYHLHIAGIRPDCGQKMNNMVFAVEQTCVDTEILVFLDGDTSLHKSYIRNLVLGLQIDGVGVTTGYHIFLPESEKFSSQIRSMWAMAGSLVLADQNVNFAIGAATAMKKSTYKNLKIGDKLIKSLSDTFVFTNAIKDANMQVLFLPQCFFISRDDSSFSEVLAWSHRLTLLSKTYSHRLWAFVGLSYGLVVFIIGTFLLSLFFRNPTWMIPSISVIISQWVAASLIAHEILYHIQKIYPEESKLLNKQIFKICALGPVTGILILFSTLESIINPITTWRGITYKIHSADEIEVLLDP
jgi:cellulose synthase/poly-beta-1,6-N-acetylglucosamine synthase-like glycosyltransferase